MKKAIAFLTVLLITNLTVQAQKKGSIEATDAPMTKLIKAPSDTVSIGETVKVIKLGTQVIDVEVLKEAVLILNARQINGFYQGIQEYPARFANPFSEYFIKYFGLKQEAPPKQK